MIQISSDIQSEAVRLAEEYVAQRVPYRHRGTSRRGCDCTGLLIAIMQEVGYMRDYELRYYPEDWNLHSGAGNSMIAEIECFAFLVPNSEALPADIAVMRFGRCPAHCGLIVRPGVMVHCFRDGQCCQYGLLKNSPWSARWVSTYRIDETKLCP